MTLAEPWPAPLAQGPVMGTVELPGSKSITNRALVLAALADGPSTITRPLLSRDTLLMAQALTQMGAVIRLPEPDAEPTISVAPGVLHGEATIDVGNAGTVMRFLPPVACLADGPVRFDGDPRARERPVGPVVEALVALGAEIEAGDRGGLPLTVHGHGGLEGGSVSIDASTSSQFVSALLLTAARFTRGVEVCHHGPPVPSLPHIAMTVAMLRGAGVEVDTSMADVWRVAPGPITARNVVVEPDLSNAAPFLAAAMVTGGSVTIRDWPTSTTQAGDELRAIFSAMGGTVSREGADLTLDGPADGTGGLMGIDADLHAVGELAPVIAAVCALAQTPSTLRGIAHLRLHETDRLAALATELGRLGLDAADTADGLVINPVTPRSWHGAVFRTYDDHRLATAAAVLGLVIPGVAIENVGTTAKTLPDFPPRWLDLLGDVAPERPGGP